MLFRTQIPGPPLSEAVEDILIHQGYPGRHEREAILPSGTVEIVFNLKADELRIYDPKDPRRPLRFGGAVVSGPYARPFLTNGSEETAILQVHCRPGRAAALLGVPANEIANAHLDLSVLWGRAAGELHERLVAAPDQLARFRLIEERLASRIGEPRSRRDAVHEAVRLLAASHGRLRIKTLARMLDLSQRWLILRFAAEVGLAPKLFARLQRFHHALARRRSERTIGWAELAAECGYFDQAHLIAEFAEFTGLTPARLASLEAAHDRAGLYRKRNHLPLIA